MPVTIHIPKELIEPTREDGSVNPFRETLITFALKQLCSKAGDMYSIVDDCEDMPHSLMMQIIAAGGEVQGLAVWIELTDVEYELEVPDYLPFSTDTEGTRYTWRQWRDASHQHCEIADSFYVPGNSMNGVELPGSVIKRLRADGFEVKTKKQFELIALNESRKGIPNADIGGEAVCERRL